MLGVAHAGSVFVRGRGVCVCLSYRGKENKKHTFVEMLSRNNVALETQRPIEKR